MTTSTGRAQPAVSCLAALGLLALAAPVGASEPKLPTTMVWTAYDIGGAGYAEASAMADAFMKAYGVRVRVIPSGTSIGRLLPMSTGKAGYGFLATEVYFATEGVYDFAVQDWGPQDLRVVLGRPAGFGIAVGADSGVRKVADLKGKRIGYVKGNPSVNVKTDAVLAFAGLGRDDIRVVWFGSYATLKSAVLANQIDGFGSVSASGHMREIEASPRGLAWAEMPAADQAGWERVRAVVDFMAPLADPDAVGSTPEHSQELASYRFPLLTTYARTAADEVYAFTKAADETFETYSAATAGARHWAVNKAGKPPADAPWHEGAIRYLKERGIWTADDQAWQERRLARLQRVMEAWDSAIGAFNDMRQAEAKKGNKIDPAEAWPNFWEKWRAKRLAGTG